MSTGSAVLERRYRLALTFYPPSWRREHGDELLGVLMDVAEHQRRVKPGAKELINLGLSGLLARIMLVVGCIPVHRRSRVAVGRRSSVPLRRRRIWCWGKWGVGSGMAVMGRT